MSILVRIIIAIIAVWLIISFLFPFLFAIVALPAILTQLFKILVVLGAIWYVWKGSLTI